MAHALRPIPEEFHPLLPLLTDTHNHMAGYETQGRCRFASEAAAGRKNPQPNGAREYIVMSVDSEDWPTSDRIAESGAGRYRAAFGVHPQCAGEVDPEALDGTRSGPTSELRRHLLRHPTALVGEIGLDKNRCFKWSYEEYQVPAFLHQLRLAASLRRPISVHSVRADGPMVQLLQAEAKARRPLPPRVCLHSFAGSLDTLKQVVTAVERGPCAEADPPRVYVGFNAWTNLWKRQAHEFVRGLAGHGGGPGPRCGAFRRGRERLLLETDWNPADFDFCGSQRQDVDKILLNGVIRLAEILEMEPGDMAALLARNTEAFLGGWSTESDRRPESRTPGAESSEDDASDEGVEPEASLAGSASKDEVDTLGLEELRAGLRSRALSAKGDEAELRQRLWDALAPNLAPDFKDVVRELDGML